MPKHVVRTLIQSWTVAAIVGSAALLATNAAGQSYPERVVEVAIPGTPGTSADIVGRVLLDGMSQHLGQRFIAVNKPGAGGVTATVGVAQAKPDGYTLLHGAAWTLTAAPLTELHTPYSRKSFHALCQTFKNDQVIVARPDTYRSVPELIAASRLKPGGLSYGTPGIGSIPHLAMAELSQMTGALFNQVPFRGTAEPIQMTHAGQIDFSVLPLTAAAGSNLVMPGLFASKRNPSIPSVPTASEQGFDIMPLSIGGLFAPAETPFDIRQKLEEACMIAMQSDAFKRMARNTFQPSDFMADSREFSVNIDKDEVEKRRLLSSLGMIKRAP
jgi:tripartite-type tricarboxylate transporter receptor subunit TctC